MQSVFPLDTRRLREFYKTSRSQKFRKTRSFDMTAMKTPGYILTFRCVNCGRLEACTHYACERAVSDDQIRARIYEANCEGCGWKGVVCGVSAIQIHPTPDLKLKPQE
jgi:Fe-S-cluster-containing hydrogenase component 2